MNRQKLMLLILLALLAVALIWSYTHMPRQKTVSDLKNAPGQPLPLPVSRRPAAGLPSGSNSLALDLLNREPSAFKGYRRNLFKPIFVDEIKLMKLRSAAIRPALPPIAVPAKIMPVQPVVSTEPPKRELARFTFLGFLKKDNRRTIFLARDKDIILVKKGDTFAGRYQAASITEQALTIQVTDTGEEIVIPLIDNQSLGSMR
jgi:hypothetical protein